MEEVDKYDKRIIFKKKKQREFISSAKRKLNLTWKEMSETCNVSPRTLMDWRREKFTMSLRVGKILSRKANIKLKSIEIKDPFWNNPSAAKIGGRKVYDKYGKIGGDEKVRIKKWKEWWEKEGKFQNSVIGKSKKFKKASFSNSLAEFVGIVLGDGSISKRQITITLHEEDDKEYGKFFIKLVSELFNVPVGTHKKKGSLAKSYSISRTNLVNFCVKDLGLKIGNKVKQKVDIPQWIKENEEYSISCVRGLMDTDGCVFDHKYKSGSRKYSYKKIIFTNYSEPIIDSVSAILSYNNIKSRIYKEKRLFIDSKVGVKKYFDIFGSNNKKHLKNYTS